MRAGSFFGLLLLTATVGCEQPTATSQRVPGPQTGGTETAPGTPSVSTDAAQPQTGGSAYQPSYMPPREQPVPGVNPAENSAPAETVFPVGDVVPTDPAVNAPSGQIPVQPLPDQATREKAEAGVGVRGDRIESGGIYTTPAKAYFQVRERLTFLQVDQAIQLFRGLEGRLPQSHEEFMEKVIVANQIQLPELQSGSRYVWDPEKGELMVERPR